MKRCFKCLKIKPLSEFYAHPQMKDGHLNKCVRCAKDDVAARIKIKKRDVQWMLAERERCRIKSAAARASGAAGRSTPEQKAASLRAYRAKYPERAMAVRALNNAVRDGKIKRKLCEVCGDTAQAHHDDYSKPLDVRWLCARHHADHHVQLRNKLLLAS